MRCSELTNQYAVNDRCQATTGSQDCIPLTYCDSKRAVFVNKSLLSISVVGIGLDSVSGEARVDSGKASRIKVLSFCACFWDLTIELGFGQKAQVRSMLSSVWST